MKIDVCFSLRSVCLREDLVDVGDAEVPYIYLGHIHKLTQKREKIREAEKKGEKIVDSPLRPLAPPPPSA